MTHSLSVPIRQRTPIPRGRSRGDPRLRPLREVFSRSRSRFTRVSSDQPSGDDAAARRCTCPTDLTAMPVDVSSTAMTFGTRSSWSRAIARFERSVFRRTVTEVGPNLTAGYEHADRRIQPRPAGTRRAPAAESGALARASTGAPYRVAVRHRVEAHWRYRAIGGVISGRGYRVVSTLWTNAVRCVSPLLNDLVMAQLTTKRARRDAAEGSVQP